MTSWRDPTSSIDATKALSKASVRCCRQPSRMRVPSEELARQSGHLAERDLAADLAEFYASGRSLFTHGTGCASTGERERR